MTWHNLRQQNAEAQRPAEPLPRRLRRAQGERRRGLDRRLRGQRRRHRRAGRGAREGARRLQRRSCSRCSPTASPRPSPSACTSACGASSGAMRPTSSSAASSSSPRRIAASARRRATRRAPTTPRKGRCSGCSTPSAAPTCGSPSRSPCCPPPRCRASTSRIPESSYFAVGKVGRDQVEDYARRAGMPLAEAEKWLAPYLAYELETRIIAAMGKGDKRTRKGKIYRASYGKKRPHKPKKKPRRPPEAVPGDRRAARRRSGCPRCVRRARAQETA